MKIKNFNLIKKYSGEITLTTGAGLCIYNIFNFSYRIISGNIFDTFNTETDKMIYYYPSDTLIWISIGVMLIICGILIIKNKNGRKN